ncbi:hypothetical protein Pelo_4239 [Pelomyxa schiedti]|nr:hypothetical protein Pelo_4239 [Pelomyxa schiedti]
MSAAPKLHVFFGLSATVGVVWCRGSIDGDWMVHGSVGDGRFVATDDVREGWVIDSSGCAIAPLTKAWTLSFWVNNEKWLVWGISSQLTVWRMSGGVPVGPRVHVEWSERRIIFARFSPFSPCGDELVIVSSEENTSCAFLGGGRDRLSFVDIRNSLESGVTVVTKEFQLPLNHVIDFVWADPDTILTMHRYTDNIVYNTKTGELKVFPVSQYRQMEAISPEHIAVSRPEPSITPIRTPEFILSHSFH